MSTLYEAPLRTILLSSLKWALLGTLALLALTYAGDFLLYHLRGTPKDQVVVDQMLAAPLKGTDRAEYFYQGSSPVPCSRSIFPQSSLTPCWYLRRHTTQIEKA